MCRSTDSDFNPHHPLTLSPKPSFLQDSAPLPVHFSRVMGRSDRLVLRSGPMACPGTLRTRLPNPGTRELDWFWTIRKFPRPERAARLAQIAFSVFETASDTRYRYSGSSTNWSSRGSAGSRSESPAFGGALAVANVRSGPSHRPQCRRMFSTMSRWLRSMKLTTFILDPH